MYWSLFPPTRNFPASAGQARENVRTAYVRAARSVSRGGPLRLAAGTTGSPGSLRLALPVNVTSRAGRALRFIRSPLPGRGATRQGQIYETRQQLDDCQPETRRNRHRERVSLICQPHAHHPGNQRALSDNDAARREERKKTEDVRRRINCDVRGRLASGRAEHSTHEQLKRDSISEPRQKRPGHREKKRSRSQRRDL